MIVGSRFIGFVADIHGDGRVSAGPLEAAQFADALRADPNERRLRVGAALFEFNTDTFEGHVVGKIISSDQRNTGRMS
jgi:hypothetical protein